MNCTIVIPTHNRHRKLARILSFLDKADINTVVVDSSDSYFDASGYDSVLYVHDSSLKFADKIILACELAQTDYVGLCADDDFMLVEKIEGLLTEMPKNCSAVIGSTVTFSEIFVGKFKYQKKIHTNRFFESKNSSEFFSDYSQVLWGIYSSVALQQAFSDIRIIEFKNDNFIELYLSYSLIQSGGIYRVADFFSVREVSSADHWGKRHTNLRLAYLAEAKMTLVDIAKISAFLGKDTFALNFAAYLGSEPMGMNFFVEVVRKIVRKVQGIIGVKQNVTLSHADHPELSRVHFSLTDVKND